MVANDWSTAHSAALRVLDIVPEHVPVLLVCGQALDVFRRLDDENVLAGRLTAAKHHCLAILEQRPSNQEALTQVGAIYCMTREARKARYYLSQTINPPNVPLDDLMWVTELTAALDNAHFERLVSWDSARTAPDPAVLVAPHSGI